MFILILHKNENFEIKNVKQNTESNMKMKILKHKMSIWKWIQTWRAKM